MTPGEGGAYPAQRPPPPPPGRTRLRPRDRRLQRGAPRQHDLPVPRWCGTWAEPPGLMPAAVFRPPVRPTAAWQGGAHRVRRLQPRVCGRNHKLHPPVLRHGCRCQRHRPQEHHLRLRCQRSRCLLLDGRCEAAPCPPSLAGVTGHAGARPAAWPQGAHGRGEGRAPQAPGRVHPVAAGCCRHLPSSCCCCCCCCCALPAEGKEFAARETNLTPLGCSGRVSSKPQVGAGRPARPGRPACGCPPCPPLPCQGDLIVSLGRGAATPLGPRPPPPPPCPPAGLLDGALVPLAAGLDRAAVPVRLAHQVLGECVRGPLRRQPAALGEGGGGSEEPSAAVARGSCPGTPLTVA